MSNASQKGVLFVDQSGELGGAELSLLDIVRHRRESGAVTDSVAIFSEGPFAARLRRTGVKVTLLPLAVGVRKLSGPLSQLAAAPQVLSAARKLAALAHGHSLIHANTQKAAAVGAIAAKLARRPLIWHLRDMLDGEHFSAANRRIVVAMTNRSASRVIANSQATAEAYRRAGGRIDVIVIHNGVDAGLFNKTDLQARDRLYAHTRISPLSPIVGVFGRLTHWKGQHVLLDALERAELGDVHALVVGDALFTDEDQCYADSMRRRSENGRLARRIHWLGQRDDVPALMADCDVIVHCSTQPEPFGRVIVEGQFAGRPVVATAAGGALEIIEDGVNGYLVPPGDSVALAATLTRILNDPEEATRVAEVGRTSARTRFRLEDRVAEIDAVIEDVVRSAR